jgi:hypothetical protein
LISVVDLDEVVHHARAVSRAAGSDAVSLLRTWRIELSQPEAVGARRLAGPRPAATSR